ncbi:MAG: VOC family protein [Nanoarchaeota archaeon]
MKLNHIHLKISSLKKSEAFYINILGFKVRERVGPFLFLHLGEEHHALALQERDDANPVDENTLGLYHFALEVQTKKEFQEIMKKLKENNIDYGLIDHVISKAIYFSDPDNNGIEIMIDTRKQKDQIWKGKNLPLEN